MRVPTQLTVFRMAATPLVLLLGTLYLNLLLRVTISLMALSELVLRLLMNDVLGAILLLPMLSRLMMTPPICLLTSSTRSSFFGVRCEVVYRMRMWFCADGWCVCVEYMPERWCWIMVRRGYCRCVVPCWRRMLLWVM